MTRYPYTLRTCRVCSVLLYALFYPGRLIRNPITAWEGNTRAVSPCGTPHPVCQECLVRQQGALAHLEYTTNGCPCTVPIPPRGSSKGNPWRIMLKNALFESILVEAISLLLK